MRTPIELLADERKRQIEVEGYTAEHDDGYDHDEAAFAAACYSLPEGFREFRYNGTPFSWHWDSEWWKPTPDDRIRELVKAGALIVAEIERLQRLESH